MKKNKLDAIGFIDDQLVEKADEYTGVKKKNTWIKWGAMVACLCLVVAVFPSVSNILHHKGASTNQDDPVKMIAAYEYNGAFYEFIDNKEVLEKYGLPGKITAAQAGEHLGWLEKDGDGYKDCVHETDIELYTYAPHPCVGVLVIRDGDHYGAALFCNHILIDDSCVEFGEIYRVYDVEKADDIVSICEFNGIFGHEKVSNKTTDRDVINAFYNASLSLDCFGNDSFQELEFGSFDSEEDQVAHHIEYADAMTNLRIETASGLVFFVRAVPSYGWLESDLSYFKFNDSMTKWFAEYIK